MPDVLMVPTAVLLLTQVPPLGVAFKVVVFPAQTTIVPLIAEGLAFTVMTFVA